ncbi:MAG: DUF2095 family protein [Nitrososphaerota archaeon]|nr:DUF2095 domain-containing protein [Candidatus Bathyarchaeota archaeon]MDW8048101.1 DUF2095 family protein [Nitrososphaerota archaeon]
MRIEKERFKKMFPHLAEEMEKGEHSVTITSVKFNNEVAENAPSRMFEGYDPDVIDFLRRCDNEKQAEEIISYLEIKKEISEEYAERLRKQLKERGVRSFGPKKENDYYLKKAGY